MEFTNDEMQQLALALIDRREKLRDFIASPGDDEMNPRFELQLPVIESALRKLGVR